MKKSNPIEPSQGATPRKWEFYYSVVDQDQITFLFVWTCSFKIAKNQGFLVKPSNVYFFLQFSWYFEELKSSSKMTWSDCKFPNTGEGKQETKNNDRPDGQQ